MYWRLNKTLLKIVKLQVRSYSRGRPWSRSRSRSRYMSISKWSSIFKNERQKLKRKDKSIYYNQIIYPLGNFSIINFKRFQSFIFQWWLSLTQQYYYNTPAQCHNTTLWGSTWTFGISYFLCINLYSLSLIFTVILP